MDFDHEITAGLDQNLPKLSVRAAAAVRRRLDVDFAQAVADTKLEIAYQPRICLSSGAIIAQEALIRWQDRRHGLLLPSTILPLAERTRLSEIVGGWVLEEACRDAARWSSISVCVNVSGRQVRSGVILAQVANALRQSGLAAERLELEMNEDTMLTGGIDTLLVLSGLRDLGVGLSLDDFGTGYGNLAALRRLPLTAILLDRSVIRNLPDQSDDAAIAHAIIQTGHAIGITMVAEGIETQAQLALLTGLGCDAGQGFLFGLPVREGGRAQAA